MLAIVLVGIGAVSFVFFMLRILLIAVSEERREYRDTAQGAEVKKYSEDELRAQKDRRQRVMLRNTVYMALAGIVLVSGVFLLAAGRGGNLLGKIRERQTWDDINISGKYVDEDNNEYTYYIVLSGEEIFLSGEPCTDLEDLRAKLTEIRQENTIMLIDSYSVASLYHDTENLLKALGIHYKTVEK